MGSDHPAYTVTVEICEEMREWDEEGHTQREIEDEFGVPHGTVHYHISENCVHAGERDEMGCLVHPNRLSEGHARLAAMGKPRPGEHVLETIERGLQALSENAEDNGGEEA